MVDRVLYWNCAGGIKSKIDYLRNFLKDQKFQLMFISESDIVEQDLNLVQIPGFDILMSSSLRKARTMCYVSSKLSYRKIKLNHEDLDVVAIDISNERYVGLYRPFKMPPNHKPASYFNELISYLKEVSKTDKRLIIGGDFNVDLNKSSHESGVLEDWAINSGLQNLVEKNVFTRLRIVKRDNKTVLEASTIDHIYSNNNMTLTLMSSISDHLFLVAERPDGIVDPRAKKKKTIVRDWRFYEKDEVNLVFSENMAQISTDSPTLEQLTHVYNTTLNEVAPLRVVKYKENEVISSKVAALQKRRDRFLKKYKKTRNPEHLEKAKSFSCTLKKAVKKEARRIFQCKARSPNPNHFWQVLNEKLGKYRDTEIELELDGVKVTDPVKIANLFGDFFVNKVKSLAVDKVAELNLSPPSRPLNISLSEVELALMGLSNKKSFGVDNIPQNLFKDTGVNALVPIYNVLNSFCRFGLPDALKTARVIPLHKKGSKIEISNYRPISNLSVFSKVYEKCLLSRLNEELKDAEGDHQHGFRKGHSTETALLTLQSLMASMIDAGKQGLVYSVDLSAAFDLLKPDKFVSLFKERMSEGLLYAIADFLTNRKFVVNLCNENSETKLLDRGCVQGSILGPKLFSLYVSKLRDYIETDEIRIVSYADDSYVVLTPKKIENTAKLAEDTLNRHISFLRSIGMVVNEAKTEIMWIGDNPLIEYLTIGTNKVHLSKQIKALGILIQGNLSWDSQAELAINKSKKLLSAFRFLRKYLTESQFLKAASANYYGSVYYASSVWFQNTKAIFKTRLNSIHFRLLRTAKRDFKMKFSRCELTHLCKRATPEQWSKFITASRVIKIVRSNEPKELSDLLKSTYFEEKRKPGVGLFFDSSRLLKGRQSIQNRLLFMRSISYPWNTEKTLSDDLLRIEMKKTYFPHISSSV